MMKSMSSEELLKLKPGNTVVIKGKTYVVESRGPKWVKLKDSREIISIQKASTHHANYHQWEESIFKDLAHYQAYENYCKCIDDANAVIQQFRYKNTTTELLAVADFIRNLRNKKEA